jgi:hypothetical protein
MVFVKPMWSKVANSAYLDEHLMYHSAWFGVHKEGTNGSVRHCSICVQYPHRGIEGTQERKAESIAHVFITCCKLERKRRHVWKFHLSGK